MHYVKDLENIKAVRLAIFVRVLISSSFGLFQDEHSPRERLDLFINDDFHNFAELHARHLHLMDQFHEIQRGNIPPRSITAALFDAALNFREAYMEYIPNYPIAAYRVDDEVANNPHSRRSLM
jgi:RHO1 GDP-GTP exchange protein 1/2